ncbi:hypothetical protein OB08_07850 [Microbacterium sp. HJ5]
MALALVAATVASPAAAAPVLPDPAPADVTAVASLEKTASVTTITPGGTFLYTLTVGCSSITDAGCRGAVLTDAVPAPFEVVGAVVGAGANTASTPVIVGNTVTVEWTTPLGDDTTGILDATTAIVEVEVRLPDDVSHDVSGVPVVNNADIEGVNFSDVDAEVSVTPDIPLDLSAAANKVLAPTTALATPGTAVAAELRGTNTSNATVDQLVLQDPIDPTAAANPFERLGFAGFGAVSAPAGATPGLTRYEVFVGGGWMDAPGGVLPGGVSAPEVRGTRVTFGGSIPSGAVGVVPLDLAVTADAAAEPDGTVVTNTVSSSVTMGDASATATAEATFTLRQNEVAVTAGKAFEPHVVVAGQRTAATLDARNSSVVPIETLAIREPSSGTLPAAYAFAGIGTGIPYPAGATSGRVVYHTAAGAEEVPFGNGTVPGEPTAGMSGVEWFEVIFDGAIQPGGETSVEFELLTDGDLADSMALPATITNEALVTGSNQGVQGTASAADRLYVYDEVIETYIAKSLRPSRILAAPGQIATVSLQGGLTERPDPPATVTGSTGNADRIVLQDPVDPVAGDPWWNAFDLTAIAQTPVPGGSTLTIEYYDTSVGTWRTLTAGITGPTIHAEPVPTSVRAVAGGIRFVYDYTDPDSRGLPPGTDLAPNFTAELRDHGRDTGTPPFDSDAPTLVPNCAQSSAVASTTGVQPAASSMPSDECPAIELIPVDPTAVDLIDKEFGTSSSGGVKSVIARSGNTIPSTLRWSTGGYAGFERLEITDVATPATTPIAQSLYDAFDLRQIQPITVETDPLIAYDQVTSVQLWRGGAWVAATDDPCPEACVGQFPGVTLTTGERSNTTGVRLTLAESPDRLAAADGDLDAPPVGSGVARSFANERPVTLVWQVRDTRRSDGVPVLGDVAFNTGDEGVVRNTARAEGFPDSGTSIAAVDADDVVIVDVPLTTTTDKNWQGGPLAVPPSADIPDAAFPHSRVTVTTRNTTPARVDRMVITDPAPGSVTGRRFGPFDGFVLTNFSSISNPGGAVLSSTTVTLFCPDGTSVDYTRAEALALVPTTMPCDVIGLQVSFEGRIAANEAGRVAFDVRLRPFWRGTDERVSIADSPVFNTAEGIVADIDPVGPCPPPAGARWACDRGTANIGLAEPTFGIAATKDISPGEQKADDFEPVTVTLGAQPTGTLRTRTATLTDSDPSFWNAFDFVGMDPTWDFVPPVGRVQACYLAGGSFTADSVASDTVGGQWTCQSTADQSIAAAVAFLAGAPDDVHGVSFQFWQAVDIGWLNPTHPYVTVPFLVQRRTDLRSGGAVPTTRADQAAAPGEMQAGIFVDTVVVESVSAPVSAGQALTARATADDEYRHVHLEASVSVTKSPSGHVQPGAAIPFSLQFTNTGEAPLRDPVFSDRLPVDAVGRQLILDPDRDPAVSPYSFRLTGAAPASPNGSRLPIDPGDVVVDEVGDTVFFRMPAGSVLEPGQTYTIGATLMLRPGLTPSDEVQNWAAVGVDVPLDQCVPTRDPETGECLDDAIVSPLPVPALSTVKYVKADTPHGQSGIPEVHSVANGFSCEAAATAAGFHRGPCVPVTLPGGTETWRFTVTNAGTLPMDRLVSIDNLPTPGDQGLIVTLPRESQWQPRLLTTGTLVGAPTGSTLRTYASSAEVPCVTDLNPLTAQCTPGAWTEVTPTTDLSAVRSLKFVVDFAADALFLPGRSLAIEFRTRTVASERIRTALPVAWNTVVTGGSAIAASGRIAVPATEGRRVGVAYATGTIGLQKTLSGPAQHLAPEEFPVTLQCRADDVPVVGLPDVVLVPGADAVTVDGLPLGAVCTAVEGHYGQTAARIDTATVGGPDEELGVVSIGNVYEVADLTIRKAIATPARDHRGAPIVYGPFDFAVECTFRGQPVYATGYGPDEPMTAALDPTETWALDGLVVGARCVVEETKDLGALSTSIEVDGVRSDGAAAETVIAQDHTVRVVATNEFGAGALDLRKAVVGAAEEFAHGPFELEVTCVLDTGAGPALVWAGHVMVGGNRALDHTIERIPSGAECTVEETDDGGATETVIHGSPARIPLDQSTAVTITNTFEAGSIVVTKSLSGVNAGTHADDVFEVTARCEWNGREIDIPGSPTRSLSADHPAVYEGLPAGAACAITETDSGSADVVMYSPAAPGGDAAVVTVEASTAAQVAIDNRFDAVGTPLPPSLPATGADLWRVGVLGLVALAILMGGALALLATRGPQAHRVRRTR